MVKKKRILVLLIILVSAKVSLGYVDPGTTGMIIGGSIWPFILGVLAVVGGFFLKYFKVIKGGLLKLFKRIKGKD